MAAPKAGGDIAFLCEIREAYVIKVLNELLRFYTKKVGTISLKADGIEICATDDGQNQHRVLVQTVLKKTEFNSYYCARERIIAANLSNMYTMLKPIRKKDTLTLYIEDNSPNHLVFKVQTGDNNSQFSNSRIPIHNAQPIVASDINYPLGDPININSAEFQKMCREMNGISREMEIRSDSPYHIRFYCNGNDIGDKYKEFRNDNKLLKPDTSKNRVYRRHFLTQYITKLNKMAGQGKTVKVYPTSEEHPLVFKMNVGSLGEITIFLNSNEKIRDEELLHQRT